MSLKLTLKPDELFVVNGCVMRNSNRRHTLIIENFADVIRGADLLSEETANTPVKQVYFLIQTALIEPTMREDLNPHIQKQLGKLFTVFGDEMREKILTAANHVSTFDYYKALASLRSVAKYEERLLNLKKTDGHLKETDPTLCS